MKKLLITAIISASVLSSAFAATNTFMPITTLDEANRYCPSTGALSFSPNNPSIPNSAGTVIGTNQINFASIPERKAIFPKNMQGNLIIGVEFREANGMYGYISNDVVTCLYSYTGFTGNQFALTIRSTK